MASEWERQQRAAERERERQRKAAEAAAKAAEKARVERYRENQRQRAERSTADVAAREEELRALLTRGLRHRAKPRPADLKRHSAPPPLAAGGLEQAQPAPAWTDYEPVQAGFLTRMFSSARIAEELADARARFEAATEAWRQGERRRERALEEARSRHEAAVAEHVREVEEYNRRVEELFRGVEERDREAVQEYITRVLERMPLPGGFPRQCEVVYNPHTEQLVVRQQLPGRDVIPTIRGHRYVLARDELQPVAKPPKEVAELYRSVVAQESLLVLHNLFAADERLATAGFNGHVDAIDPGTGRRMFPCIISLDVERSKFEELVLEQVTPEVCLRRLNALVSSHPYDLEPVTPILDFDLTKYSFVQGLDAVSSLDSRPDLMQMGHEEFEHLVRQVFEAMGLEGWTTEQSGDEGVDGVITNTSPLVGGLAIVQAKRYARGIGPAHIRELAGSMEAKKAGRGILVTTSWFTADSWKASNDHGRMELIDGPRLKHLIKEHLGKDVLIGIQWPKGRQPRQ